MNINLVFNNEQCQILDAAGASLNVTGLYSREEIEEIDGKVKDYLVYAGFDESYKRNEKGRVSREIINYLRDVRKKM